MGNLDQNICGKGWHFFTNNTFNMKNTDTCLAVSEHLAKCSNRHFKILLIYIICKNSSRLFRETRNQITLLQSNLNLIVTVDVIERFYWRTKWLAHVSLGRTSRSRAKTNMKNTKQTVYHCYNSCEMFSQFDVNFWDPFQDHFVILSNMIKTGRGCNK